jgi:hypothetical protein
VNTSKVTIRNIVVACIVVTFLIVAGWRTLAKRPVTVADTSAVKVGMSKIQVLWRLGKPHHATETTQHESCWWAYSENGEAPAKYFNVVSKLGSVVQVADTSDFSRPQLLKDDEAPLPKKKVETQR